jgi:polyhydroxyalkanoate synthesis regulator phasin
MAKNSLRKLFEAGVQFHEMSRQQAEAAVKKMVKAGDVRRSEAEATVQALIERSRETALAIAEAVQNEVTKQLGWLANRVDDVEDQMEGIVSRFSPLASSSAPAKKAPAKKAPAKKAAAKKAAANKAPATRTAAKTAPAKRTARRSTARKAPTKKKAAAKRSTARTSTAKRSPAKKAATGGAVGSSGVRKVATSRPS